MPDRVLIYLVTHVDNFDHETVLYAHASRESAQAKIDKLKADDSSAHYFMDVVLVMP